MKTAGKSYRVACCFLAFIGLVLCFFSIFLVERQVIYPTPYKTCVVSVCQKYSLDAHLVYSLIKTESNFNVNAKSNKGAKGLMQITDKTGEYIAQKLSIQKFDLFSHEDNINFGCYYLRYLIDKFKSVNTALAAYNAGEGNVRAWLKNSSYSLDGVNLKIIPFKETDKYIKKINKTLNKYKKLYGNILDKTTKKK